MKNIDINQLEDVLKRHNLSLKDSVSDLVLNKNDVAGSDVSKNITKKMQHKDLLSGLFFVVDTEPTVLKSKDKTRKYKKAMKLSIIDDIDIVDDKIFIKARNVIIDTPKSLEFERLERGDMVDVVVTIDTVESKGRAIKKGKLTINKHIKTIGEFFESFFFHKQYSDKNTFTGSPIVEIGNRFFVSASDELNIVCSEQIYKLSTIMFGSYTDEEASEMVDRVKASTSVLNDDYDALNDVFDVNIEKHYDNDNVKEFDELFGSDYINELDFGIWGDEHISDYDLLTVYGYINIDKFLFDFAKNEITSEIFNRAIDYFDVGSKLYNKVLFSESCTIASKNTIKCYRLNDLKDAYIKFRKSLSYKENKDGSISNFRVETSIKEISRSPFTFKGKIE